MCIHSQSNAWSNGFNTSSCDCWLVSLSSLQVILLAELKHDCSKFHLTGVA